jgi:hypothetical protein
MLCPNGLASERALCDKNFAGSQANGLVDVQNFDGSAAYRSQADQRGVIPPEMIAPNIASGIEEPGQGSRLCIDSGDVGSFVSIAVETTEGQIPFNRFATVLACDDVVDVKRLVVKRRCDVAIFAAISGSISNLLFEQLVHESSCWLMALE